MPVWGWICAGVAGVLAVAGLGLLVFLLLPDKRRERLLREGKTVVAHILLAHPSLYDAADRSAFGFAFVMFTLDDDASPEHLDFLSSIAGRLENCSQEADADEQQIARALGQQVTVGAVPLRVPIRLTGGRSVYFATPSIMRRLLPESCLVRNYIYLKVIPDGKHRGLTMIEPPPRSHPRT
jgi:hypothetical protein